MSITPQQALQRTIEHREIFFDEMLSLMRQIMAGEISPVMTAAILTGLRVKKETISEITAAATVMREMSTKVVVEPPHDQDIPIAGIRQGFIQARPGRFRAAGRVGEHLFATGRRQGVALQVHALIVGRYPRVTDLHVFVRLFDETGSL